MAKTFAAGELVEIQREVGSPWTQHLYQKKCSEVNSGHGYHVISVEEHYVDSMTGNNTTGDNPRAFRSTIAIIPSRRVRKIKAL